MTRHQEIENLIKQMAIIQARYDEVVKTDKSRAYALLALIDNLKSQIYEIQYGLQNWANAGKDIKKIMGW